MAYDLIIKNATLRDSKESTDIGVQGGRIASIGKSLHVGSASVIDAKGGLVTEPFVNGHLHLCKVYTVTKLGSDAIKTYHTSGMGGAMTAIEQAAAVKADYKEEWIIENARRACNLALKYGNLWIRAFADVDTKARLEGVKALIKVREEFRGRVDLQVVAFPQDGLLRDPGAEEYVEQAMQLGADVVGGIPWIEFTDEDAQEHVNRMFDLAVKYDRDVSMLVDDAGDPTLRTIEMMGKEMLKRGWQGRATAQHCRGMALYPEPYFRRLQGLMKEAGLGLVSDPHTGPLHARVRDLYEAGIPVALGQDDIADAYYPFGKNNMQEVAFLAAHLLWMTSLEDMDILYDLITKNAARVLGIKDYGLKEGGPADFVILKAPDVWHAIWEHEAPAYVIRGGKDITLVG